MKLTSIINAILANSDVFSSWHRLFLFSAHCLSVPPRGGCHRSLTKIVNNQIQSESDPPLPLKLQPGQKKQKDPLEYLATRVSSKIEEGDFKGAIRLATSDDKFAQDNATYFQ